MKFDNPQIAELAKLLDHDWKPTAQDERKAMRVALKAVDELLVSLTQIAACMQAMNATVQRTADILDWLAKKEGRDT